MSHIWPYLLVVLGMFIEGEMALLSTTIAGHQGLISLPIAIPCAIAGTFLADLVHFTIGRKGGRQRIEKNPKWKAKADGLQNRLERSPFMFLLGIRFMYGFRVITPIVVGMTGMSFKRFAFYSIITILIWTAVYVSLGYAFGAVIQTHLTDIQNAEKYIIGSLISVGIIVFLVKKRKR